MQRLEIIAHLGHSSESGLGFHAKHCNGAVSFWRVTGLQEACNGLSQEQTMLDFIQSFS